MPPQGGMHPQQGYYQQPIAYPHMQQPPAPSASELRAQATLRSDLVSHTLEGLPSDVRTWRQPQIDSWFQQLGGWISQYEVQWKKDSIFSVGADLLMLAGTDSEMDALGIQNAIHRNKFKTAISQLNQCQSHTETKGDLELHDCAVLRSIAVFTVVPSRASLCVSPFLSPCRRGDSCEQ